MYANFMYGPEKITVKKGETSIARHVLSHKSLFLILFNRVIRGGSVKIKGHDLWVTRVVSPLTFTVLTV